MVIWYGIYGMWLFLEPLPKLVVFVLDVEPAKQLQPTTEIQPTKQIQPTTEIQYKFNQQQTFNQQNNYNQPEKSSICSRTWQT